MAAKNYAWSFSALNNFETCPKKFWHLRVQKDVKEEEGPAIQYGKKVHKAFELYVSRGKKLPTEFQHMEPYVERFRTVHHMAKVEQQLAINADFQPTGWFDKDVWCRAVIDLAVIGDKTALLVDYKTGKMKDDGFTQLKLAAAIFMLHFSTVETVQVAYLWTENSGKLSKDSFHRSEMAEMWNDLLPRVNAFREAHQRDNFPAKPSGLCRNWCPVSTCPHHGN